MHAYNVYINAYKFHILLQLNDCRPLPERDKQEFPLCGWKTIPPGTKALPKWNTHYWPYKLDGLHPWIWFNYFTLFQHLEKQLALLPWVSSCLEERKNPSSAWAVNSMYFWNRNLNKSSLHLCRVQSENAIAVIHLYFSNASCSSSLSIYFKNHCGWKLGDCAHKSNRTGECVYRNGNSKVNTGIWGRSDGI